MKFAIVGYGRMGRAVEAEAMRRGHTRTAILRRGWSDSQAEALSSADVAFEFSVPSAAEANVAALLRANVSVVCGTTGWEPGAAFRDAMRQTRAAVMIAPNFSPGVNLFFRLVERAARDLGRAAGFEPFVLEHHHRGKRDMPSGTARRLVDALVEADPGLQVVEGAVGNDPVPANAVHVACIRAGGEPGTHVVGFDGPDDIVRLEHSARGRTGFASGAVMAGEWLAGRSGQHEFESALDDWIASRNVPPAEKGGESS